MVFLATTLDQKCFFFLEIQENEDIVHEQGLDTELLEQLVLKLTKLEEKIFVLVKYLKHLDCGICKSHPMAKLEVTDSGELLCKACIMHRFTGGSTSYPVTQNTDTEHVVVRVDFNGMAPRYPAYPFTLIKCMDELKQKCQWRLLLGFRLSMWSGTLPCFVCANYKYN